MSGFQASLPYFHAKSKGFEIHSPASSPTSGAIPVIMAFGYTCSLVASNFALSKQAVVCLQVRFVAAPLPAKATVLREPFWNTEVKLVYGEST